MTIKELARFTGKTEKTVQRWVAKSNDKMTLDNDKITLVKGQETNLTIDQVGDILNASSMSKDAVNILMQNAREPKQITTYEKTSQINNMEEIAKMVSVAVVTTLAPLMQEFTRSMASNFSNIKTSQLSLPEAPGIEPRPYLNQLVREYATLKNVSFQTGWNVLYNEMLYRCKENIKVKAKNEGIKPIDYLEREGKLLVSCSIMKELVK